MNKEYREYMDAVSEFLKVLDKTISNIQEDLSGIAIEMKNIRDLTLLEVDKKINELKEDIENHDCKNSQDDSCTCDEARLELINILCIRNKIV
jgi:hypothetical protein